MDDQNEEQFRDDLEFVPLFKLTNVSDAIFLQEVFDTEKVIALFDNLKISAFPTDVGHQAEILISVNQEDFERAHSLIESAIQNNAIASGGAFVEPEE